MKARKKQKIVHQESTKKNSSESEEIATKADISKDIPETSTPSTTHVDIARPRRGRPKKKTKSDDKEVDQDAQEVPLTQRERKPTKTQKTVHVSENNHEPAEYQKSESRRWKEEIHRVQTLVSEEDQSSLRRSSRSRKEVYQQKDNFEDFEEENETIITSKQKEEIYKIQEPEEKTDEKTKASKQHNEEGDGEDFSDSEDPSKNGTKRSTSEEEEDKRKYTHWKKAGVKKPGYIKKGQPGYVRPAYHYVRKKPEQKKGNKVRSSQKVSSTSITEDEYTGMFHIIA